MLTPSSVDDVFEPLFDLVEELVGEGGGHQALAPTAVPPRYLS